MLFRYSTGGEGTVKWDIVMVQRLYSYTLIPLQTLDITHVPQMLINLDIITIGYGIKKLDRNRQWRIQGCANTRGAAPTYYLAKSLLKTARKWKKLDSRGQRRHVFSAPLGSANRTMVHVRVTPWYFMYNLCTSSGEDLFYVQYSWLMVNLNSQSMTNCSFSEKCASSEILFYNFWVVNLLLYHSATLNCGSAKIFKMTPIDFLV